MKKVFGNINGSEVILLDWINNPDRDPIFYVYLDIHSKVNYKNNHWFTILHCYEKHLSHRQDFE
jgi:hypothetical protein